MRALRTVLAACLAAAPLLSAAAADAPAAPPPKPPAKAEAAAKPAAGPAAPAGAAAAPALPADRSPATAAAPVRPPETPEQRILQLEQRLALQDRRQAELEHRIAGLEAGGSPAAQAQAQAQAEAPKSQGLIPNVLFGPKLNLISLPVPGIGLEVKAYRYFGFSFDYGLLPKLPVNGTKIGMTDWRTALKAYPFAGEFFVGVGYGKWAIQGTNSTALLPGGTATATLDAGSAYVLPEIGWTSVSPSGFFSLIELGWHLNTGYTSGISGAGAPGGLTGIKDNLDKYAKGGLPLIGLLQLGWLF